MNEDIELVPLTDRLVEVVEQEREPGKAGRPTKFSQERVDRFLQAVRAGNTLGAACRYAGFSEDSLSVWRKQYTDFSEAIEKALAEAEVMHVANIAKAAKAGNWTASAWWLERRYPEEWGRKDRVIVEGEAKKLAEELGIDDPNTLLRLADQIVSQARR